MGQMCVWKGVPPFTRGNLEQTVRKFLSRTSFPKAARPFPSVEGDTMARFPRAGLLICSGFLALMPTETARTQAPSSGLTFAFQPRFQKVAQLAWESLANKEWDAAAHSMHLLLDSTGLIQVKRKNPEGKE